MGWFNKPCGWLGATLFVAVLGPAAGCNQRSYDLAEVSGVVTLDGKPLAGAHVTFQPMAEGNDRSPGPGSVGICDQQGRYTLQTIDGEEGAAVGRHRVKIRTHAFREAPKGDVDTQRVVERVPPWYNDNSQLEFPVPAEGTTEANFQLSTRPPR